MPRCEFEHPDFGLSQIYKGDGSGRCWLTDVTNFGTEETPRYFCVFHPPKSAVPINRPEWLPEHIGRVQSRQLLGLLNSWNYENSLRKKDEKLALVLPKLHCGEFKCPDRYEFSGPINLKGAKFCGALEFSGAVFENHVYFDDVDFIGIVRADSTKFAGNVTFARSRFHKNVNLEDAFFKGYTDFLYVTFVGSASFSRARFEGDDANFMGSRFKGYAGFDSAVFERRVFFNEACFRDLALFQSVRFNDALTMRKTKFFGEFKLLMCELCYPLSLIDCDIHQFRYSTHLGARLTFNRCRAFDRNRKTPNRKLGFWDFQDADCSELSFINILDMSKVDFLGANVRKTEFVSCEWSGKPYSKVYGHDKIFIKYGNGDSRELGLLRALYRQLKVNLEENHEFAAAGDYHYQEMEIRRLLAKDRNNNMEAWILSTYKSVADYGESYLKLSAWLVASFLLTAMLISFGSFVEVVGAGKFHSVFMNMQEAAKLCTFSSLFEHVKNLFFTLVPSGFQKEAAREYIQCLNGWEKAVIVAEGIMLLILVTLFVMAVRRRFRR